MGHHRKPTLFAGRTSRLETLIDSVFSIVMTLMVFNISLPKDRPITNLRQELFALWPSFLAYAISFGMAGIYWSANHNMFRFIKRTSHNLNWLTIGFLGCVSLLPFSTGLLAQYNDNPTALVFYGVNLILIGSLLCGIWTHATTHRRLTDPHLPENVVRFGRSRILTGIYGYGLATALAPLNTTVSLTFFLLIPILFVLSPLQHLWIDYFGLRHIEEAEVEDTPSSLSPLPEASDD
ncbi:MAG: DUF1211 domain-containing protein [Planctomycetes bacterium]|nr:DUF1211 domain-containing protein [Planctomycetota bacterium]